MKVRPESVRVGSAPHVTVAVRNTRGPRADQRIRSVPRQSPSLIA